MNGEYARKEIRFVNGGGSLLGSGNRIAFNLISVGPASIENRVIAIPEEQHVIPASASLTEIQAAELQAA